jgi:hypothetical protein
MHTHKSGTRFLSGMALGNQISVRSSHEWLSLLDGELEHALKYELLLPASPSEFDGFMGLFDFEAGLKTYTLQRFENSVMAIPSDNLGPNYRVSEDRALLLRANPSRLFQRVFEENGFTPDGRIKGLPEGVALARRTVGLINALCIISTDPKWTTTAARDSWLNSILAEANHVILLTPTGQAPGWQLRPGVRLDSAQIPLWRTGFKFPRHLYCRKELGHTPIDAMEVYPEKDIIVDEETGEVVLFRTRLKTKKDTRGNLYMRGLMKMGTSPVSMDFFAKTYLLFKLNFEQGDKVRDAKKELKERIAVSFKSDDELGVKVAELICPRSDDAGFVTKPFDQKIALLWGVDELQI